VAALFGQIFDGVETMIRNCQRRHVLWKGIVLAVTLHMWSSYLFAHAKTDIVHFKNGDRLTVEIKSLGRGKLKVKTTGMGTIEIEWDKIDAVESNYFYEVELQSGARFYGSLTKLEDEENLVISGMSDSVAVDYDRVVRLAPIDESFWQRINGSLDIGYSYTQAQNATEWNAHANATYKTEKYKANADIRSQFKRQDGAEDVVTNSLNMTLSRPFGKKWFYLGLGQLQQNQSTELDFRGLIGGGVGRYFMQTNKYIFGAIAGLALSNEQYSGQDVTQEAEIITGINFEAFRYNSPKLDFTTRFLVFPSVTQQGRVRLDLDARVKVEIFKDFFWSAYIWDVFDNEPPTTTARRNDLGVGTSFGYTF
jgi:hypothetical protein